jgi:hypothetical protein
MRVRNSIIPPFNYSILAYVRAAYCGSRNRVNAIVAITSHDFLDSVNRSLIHRQSKVHEQSRHRPDQIVD